MSRKKSTELDKLRKVAGESKRFSTVSDIPETLYTPTLFTSYNRATGLGGHPLRKMMIIHGPNQVGKSILALVIGESLSRRGFLSHILDAEYAAEKDWYSQVANSRRFDFVDSLDHMNKLVMDDFKELEKDKAFVGVCEIIDTMTKLMPESVLEKLSKDGPEKMFPAQAGWVSLWMKIIPPKLYRTQSTMVVVLQEREKIDAMAFGKKYKITLGTALQYDNCLRVRVTHSTKLKEGDQMVGVQTHYVVENNKFDGTSMAEGSFFVSNGKGSVPKGVDYVWEAVEEAKIRNLCKKKGNSIEIGEFCEVGGGWKNLRDYFRENDDQFEKLVDYLNRGARE